MSSQTASVVDPTPSGSSSDSEESWWGRYRAWPRWAHFVTGGVGAVVLLLVIVLAIGVNLYREPLPQTTGEIAVPGLGGAVEVYRDESGIPRIYADTDSDLVRAQGFVHAQDRFFEMDVRRHATAGRLAELFGVEALESDQMVRTMGWRRVAEQELGLVSADTRALLSAYAEGVNAYIATRSPSEMALEYTLLGLTGLDYDPAKWSAIDSLAWLKAMAWDLRGNMNDEIDRAVASLDNDEGVMAALYPDYDYERNLPIVERSQVREGSFATVSARTTPQVAGDLLEGVRRSVDAMPALFGEGEGLGSNSWVVSGERSATGQPLLANDPHLGTSQPGIWTQMGLHCREITPDCTLDVSGFTFSGLPGVMIGHNADVAWGFTNLGPDVTDLYLERVEDGYWAQGGDTMPLQIRTEVIKVRGEPDVTLEVRETAHGPLISDVSQEVRSLGANAAEGDAQEAGLDPEPPAPYAVALAWTALEPGTTADAIFEMNRASDWDSFRQAAALFDVPAQNLVYADTDGNIGYQSPGKIPIRRPGHDGRLPVAGWKVANDWTGQYVPFEELPSVLNPDEGFVVTANQAVTWPAYPQFLTDDWDRGYRSQRIRDLIEAEQDLTLTEMAEIQLDNRNPMAETLVPHLMDVGGIDAYVEEGVDLLAEWDQNDDADSGAAAFFNVVWARVLELTFHDDLRERIHPKGGSRWIAVVENLLTKPAHVLWDDRDTTDVVEVRDDILRQALIEARDEMTQMQSVNPDKWSWGRSHDLALTHPTLGTSGIGLVEGVFNRDGGGIGGGAGSPNATAWDAGVGYTVTTAPSMRMVISLADFDDSRWVNLTGASGHPASAHYDDQTQLFVEGRTLPWFWDEAKVQASGSDRLLLISSDDDE